MSYKKFIFHNLGANKAEKDAAEQTAKKYIETDSVPRHKPQVEIVHQGKETPGLKKLFPAWDDKLWAKVSLKCYVSKF